MHTLLIQCQYCNLRNFFKKPAWNITFKNFWQSAVTTCSAFALPYGSPRLEAIRPDDIRCFGTNMSSDEDDAVCYLVDEKNHRIVSPCREHIVILSSSVCEVPPNKGLSRIVKLIVSPSYRQKRSVSAPSVLLAVWALFVVMQCFGNVIRSLPQVTTVGGTNSGTGSISLPEDGNIQFSKCRGLLGTPEDGQSPGT
jgi:hypothetical protein